VLPHQVDDGLDKLLKMNLATQDDAGMYQAIPLNDGLQELERLWASLVVAE
jgi:hypothetical protein